MPMFSGSIVINILYLTTFQTYVLIERMNYKRGSQETGFRIDKTLKLIIY